MTGVAPVVGMLALVVNRSVDLDDQLGRWAIEVGDERPNWALPSEAKLPPGDAQQSPQQHFGETETSAEASRRCHRLGGCSHAAGPSTTQLR